MAKEKDSQASRIDTKDHYGVIVVGAGFSGLATAIQLKRKLGFEDVMVYERSSEPGGTWNYNRYPGAVCDIPFSFYSLSFAPCYVGETQWAGQARIMEYVYDTVRKFNVNNIAYEHLVTECRYSRETGLWSVHVKDLVSGRESKKTCNVLYSCVGVLSIPKDPPFDVKNFNGEVMHSARWNPKVDLAGKKVVLLGNGCTACQIIPAIVDKVGHLTQIARSRQAILRTPPLPDGKYWTMFVRYVPGLLLLQRIIIFWLFEMNFYISDIVKGRKMRNGVVEDTEKYIQETANPKYWEVLMPDFDVSAKRRVFDPGYYKATNHPNFTLLADDAPASVKGNTVTTRNGVEVQADIIILCTGFKVHDYLFPMKVYNGEGESLLDRFRETDVKTFRGTCVSGYPNLFWIMGANTATGHSSVIYTSECQVNMSIKLIKPIIKSIRKVELPQHPAPSVEVTKKAEQEYYDAMRIQLKKKVWEKDGGCSWYVDERTGLCTTLYPWSQVHFWWHTLSPREVDFIRLGG